LTSPSIEAQKSIGASVDSVFFAHFLMQKLSKKLPHWCAKFDESEKVKGLVPYHSVSLG